MKTTTEMMQREAIFRAHRNRFSARWTSAGAMAPRRPTPLDQNEQREPEPEHHVDPTDASRKP